MDETIKADLDSLPDFQGRENVYVCRSCGGLTVTVDVDRGVTPAMIRCRASGRVGREGDCDGDAWSFDGEQNVNRVLAQFKAEREEGNAG